MLEPGGDQGAVTRQRWGGREREREWKWGAGFEGLGDGWRRKRRFVEGVSRRERERERKRMCEW